MHWSASVTYMLALADSTLGSKNENEGVVWVELEGFTETCVDKLPWCITDDVGVCDVGVCDGS